MKTIANILIGYIDCHVCACAVNFCTCLCSSDSATFYKKLKIILSYQRMTDQIEMSTSENSTENVFGPVTNFLN